MQIYKYCFHKQSVYKKLEGYKLQETFIKPFSSTVLEFKQRFYLFFLGERMYIKSCF